MNVYPIFDGLDVQQERSTDAPNDTRVPLQRTLIVKKFGGTSLATIDRIQKVAAKAIASQRRGENVVLVVSAMGCETNRLLGLASQIAELGERREKDVLAATGEQAAAALVAIAIRAAGGKACSYLGTQVRILTDATFGEARIQGVETTCLRDTLERGEIPVIAGFQGVDPQGSITTLGRGGSDTTAVAIAAALGASCCEIYTDVRGIYAADPNVCTGARKLASVSYKQMLALAKLGANVLHDRSVNIAMVHRIPLHVRDAFNEEAGTWVVPEDLAPPAELGFACNSNLAQVILPEGVGFVELGTILGGIRDQGLVIDDLFINCKAFSFTVRANDAAEVRAVLAARDLTATRIVDVATISVIAADVAQDLGLQQLALAALREFPILTTQATLSTSSFSLLVERKHAYDALRALHDSLCHWDTELASAEVLIAKHVSMQARA